MEGRGESIRQDEKCQPTDGFVSVVTERLSARTLNSVQCALYTDLNAATILTQR
jgi:hypothetical protein